MDNSDILINAKSDLEYIRQVGEFLKDSRIKLDLKQNAVAEKARVDRTTLIKIDKGDSINLLSLIQILRALGKLSVLENMKVNEQISPLKMAELVINKKKRASKQMPNTQKRKSDW